MTKPLTWSNEEYQTIGNEVGRLVYDLMTNMHNMNREHFGDGTEKSGDAGPICSGVVTGLLMFLTEGKLTDEDIKRFINTATDYVLPQIRDRAALEAAGAPNTKGHA